MKIKVITVEEITREHIIDTEDVRILQIADIENTIPTEAGYERAAQAITEITGLDWIDDEGEGERICGVFDENDECLMEM